MNKRIKQKKKFKQIEGSGGGEAHKMLGMGGGEGGGEIKKAV